MLTSAVMFVAPLLLTVQAPEPGPTIRVTVDSSRKEVVVTAGPFTIAHMPANMDHGKMHGMAGTTTPLLRFEWPMEAWFRGFDIEVTDAKGGALGSQLVHHLNIMNFDRRQLLYPAVERMVAAGSETGNVSIPKTIGMPMEPGYRLAMYAAWNNLGDADIEGAWLTVRLAWSPKNLAPRPRTILPIYMDVNYNRVTDSYDLPAGRSSKSYEFTMPLTGRVLAIGGHVHDYAEFVSLEEVESGKTIIMLKVKTDPSGLLLNMPRKYYGVRGDGLKLTRGRKYRVRADYNNITGKMIPSGAMGLLAGAFAPDKLADWPVLNPENPDIEADIAMLEKIGKPSGEGEMDHEHMDHD
ncbi:MAG: hypothetical protein E4H41_01255 [Gemmatimonadales bacterium]|jgi:hypothetical protein|nr:MAG: hypothetical protein E4H41_01255 [Gemmatimonadales bacterium]